MKWMNETKSISCDDKEEYFNRFTFPMPKDLNNVERCLIVVPCRFTPVCNCLNKCCIVLQSRKQALYRLNDTCLSGPHNEYFAQFVPFSAVFTWDLFASVLESDEESIPLFCIDKLPTCDLHKLHDQCEDIFIKKAWFSRLDNCFYIDLYTHEKAVIKDFTMDCTIQILRIDPKTLNKDLYNES